MEKFKKILLSVIVLSLMIGTYAYSNSKKEYTIMFDSAGGTNITNLVVKNGEKISAPESPVREGYKFVGWTLDGEPFDFTTEITENVKLVAKWEKVDDEVEKTETENIVTFDSDGGSKVATQTIKAGSLVIKPANPTREGYKFIGWYHNDIAWDFTWKANVNITLVAKWEKIETNLPLVKPTGNITITFDSNGGSKVATQTIKAGSLVKKPVTPTKEGYKFVGWYRNNSVWNFNWIANINITLVAKWDKITPAATVEDKYTINVIPVDEFSPEIHIFVFKNGVDITKISYRIMDGNFILAEYSEGVKALKGNKAQYIEHKNNNLTIILSDGKTYKITK